MNILLNGISQLFSLLKNGVNFHFSYDYVRCFHSFFAVFGESGLFMVMNGSVKPQTMPYLNVETRQSEDSASVDAVESPAVTPISKKRHAKVVLFRG